MGERHIIKTAVGPLAVRVVGSGPIAVLWPSLFMDGRSWDRIIPELSQQRRLVVIDGPGHGGSGDPGCRYSLRDCATAAREVLQRLGINGLVDWVGNAWGGHVGLRFAVDDGGARSLVTLGSSVAALTPAERRRTHLLLALYRVLGARNVVVGGVVNVLLSSRTRTEDPEAVDLVRESLMRADRRMLRNAIASISLGREDLTHLLDRITIPTLVVTGRDHVGFTPEQARAAAQLLPNGRMEVVADAGYLVPLEAPEVTASLVREFWAAQIPTDAAPRDDVS